MVKGFSKMNILSFFGHFIWKFTNFIAGSESRTSKLSNDVSFVIFVHQTWYLEGWVKLTPPPPSGILVLKYPRRNRVKTCTHYALCMCKVIIPIIPSFIEGHARLTQSRTSDPLVKVNWTQSLTASTLLHWLVLLSVCFIYPMSGDTVQTGTGKVDPARKFKCTTAAGAVTLNPFLLSKMWKIFSSSNLKSVYLSQFLHCFW